MGKTKQKIGYSILEQLTNFRVVDDEAVQIEIIYDMIDDVRNTMIANELKKKRRLDPMYYSVCNCLPVKCRPITCTDTDGSEVESGVTEFYSDIDFVQNNLGVHSISYLGPPDFSLNFRRLNFPYGVAGSSTKNVISYMVVGNKIIYKNIDPEIGVLTLVSITKSGKCDETGECDLTAPYNIPDDFIHDLEGIVLKRLLGSAPIRRDQKNDAQDNA
jgi:hypothetical protein